MKTMHSAVIAAMAGACLLPATALAKGMPEFSFSGFGTLSAVHSSERTVDFLGNPFQPNGAGYTESWSFDPDSKLGAQVNAVFNPQWSAVVQVLSQHQHNNSYEPRIEWANIKFQVTPEVSLRAGRIALPSYTFSESRLVGYSNHWVRPPQEVYGNLAVTSNDGFDASWRTQWGSVNNTAQVYYGNSNPKVSTGGSFKSHPSWGVNDSIEVGALTLRAGYNSLLVDAKLDAVAPLFAGLQQFGQAPAPFGPQATALIEKYKQTDLKLSALALGVGYDPGDWFVLSEFLAFKGDGIFSNSRSWYVSGGYRWRNFTPFATYARSKAQVSYEPGIALPSAAPLNAGLDATRRGFSPSQSSVSFGLRWDFRKGVALKGQYDQFKLEDRSPGRFLAIPGVQSGDRVKLFTIALDFVF